MFARWLNVRIRAAEKALQQGRLDDALAAAREPDIRANPRGQQLLDALVRPLIARARLHRQAGRYREALADLDTLATLGRSNPDVETLRQRITEDMQAGAQQAAENREAYNRAADQLRAGRLETVRYNVERVEDSERREALAGELEQRAERSTQLLDQAREALDRNDVLAAVRYWRDAGRRFGRTQETERFVGRLAAACRDQIRQWHGAGRIERLMAARAALDALLPADPTLTDCERVLDLTSRAASQLAATDYTGLRQSLLRLKAVQPDAAWVNASLDALNQITAGQEALMASPLGLFASSAGQPRVADAPPPETPARAAPPPVPTMDVRDAIGEGVRLDQPLLMLVDGGGSSLLLHRDLVRIGRAGTSAEIDVPLPADVESHHADIVRRGEDYFIHAYGPVQVNRKRVQQAMLHDGDRITLGDHAKLTFARPSAKSASAALRLSHRCRLPQDVSDVILFQDTCIVGGGATCHVRTREGRGQVVLFGRGDVLHARQTAGGGHLTAPVQPVGSGQTLEFDGLCVTVKPYALGRSTA